MLKRLFGLDRLDLLTAEAKRLIVVFTVVETVILTLWLDAIFPANLLGFSVLAESPVVAIVVLFVGLLVEHLIAGVSGRV